MRITRRATTALIVGLLLLLTISFAACGGGTDASDSADASGDGAPVKTGTPKPGGSITVLEESGLAGAWPAGLDPATNTNGSVTQSYMNSIYGNLFQLGEGGKTIPDLATGYDVEQGGKSVVIHLREGVKFTDGTAFDADAVKWNLERDFKGDCSCKPTWPVSSIEAPDAHTVRINLKRPYAPLINSFHDSPANWIASPTAVRKLGDKFRIEPVGAGPFTVVKNVLSSELVLKKNPGYWKEGRPYLDGLTFKSVASDESALETLKAGQGDAYEGLQTPQLAEAFGDGFTVVNQPSTSPYVIQLNTQNAPFKDKRAREAIYYATDAAVINEKLFKNKYALTQGFTAEGGLFYEPKVPGYRGYDLQKAKQLVQQQGGMTIDLAAARSSVAQSVITALQTQWQQAGMKVTIHANPLASVIQQFTSGKWQAFLQTAGAFDPAAGVGVSFRFASNSPFTGVKDAKLDALLAKAIETNDNDQRKALYDQAAKLISDEAYAPFLFPVGGWSIARKGIQGPGLTTPLPGTTVRPEILWEEVSHTQ